MQASEKQSSNLQDHDENEGREVDASTPEETWKSASYGSQSRIRQTKENLHNAVMGIRVEPGDDDARHENEQIECQQAINESENSIEKVGAVEHGTAAAAAAQFIHRTLPVFLYAC